MIEKTLKKALQKVVEDNKEAFLAAVRETVRELLAAELKKLDLPKRVMEVQAELAEPAKEPQETPDTAQEEPRVLPEAAQPADAAPALDWCYGGWNGSKAKISPDAVLKGATLKGNTLSISWEKGGCEQLGAADKSDANETMACLFLADGKGGKFEWISSSRKTRSVKNIREGYEGWPKDALDDGGKLWFCICGKGGKRTACVEVIRA